MAGKRELYTVYISYFLKKIAVMVPMSEIEEFLHKHIGLTVKGASLARLRSTAHLLYLSQLVRHVTCYPMWEMAFKRKLSMTELKDFIDEALALRKKYGIPEPDVQMGTSPKVIEAAIKHIVGEQKSSRYLKEILEPESESESEPEVKPRSKPKAKPRGRPRVKPTSSRGSCKTYLIKDLRKMAAEQKIKGRGSMNKAELCKALGIEGTSSKSAKKCKDYYVAELRSMATKKKIKGRSSMSKTELCKALKIKV